MDKKWDNSTKKEGARGEKLTQFSTEDCNVK